MDPNVFMLMVAHGADKDLIDAAAHMVNPTMDAFPDCRPGCFGAFATNEWRSAPLKYGCPPCPIEWRYDGDDRCVSEEWCTSPEGIAAMAHERLHYPAPEIQLGLFPEPMPQLSCETNWCAPSEVKIAQHSPQPE